MFISTRWGYGPSEVGVNDNAFLGLGPIHFFLSISGIVSGIFLLKTKKLKAISIFSFIVVLVASFLMHFKSSFIWGLVPQMAYFQFPWRFLLLAVFFSSILGGISFEALIKKKKGFILIILVIFVLIFYGSFFKPKEWYLIDDEAKLSGDNYQRQVTASIYDYLPKSAVKAPGEMAPRRDCQ